MISASRIPQFGYTFQRMVSLSRYSLILLTLLLCGARVSAATVSENRAFSAATNKFNSGFWEQAEKDFAEFTRKFPSSTRVSEAILYRAESQFYLKQFSGAIELLSNNRTNAGKIADQYLYWAGKAHFENTNYPAAAEIFDEVIKKFPESPLALDATIREGSALARLREWARLAALLQRPNGAFQKSARANSTNLTLAAGFLLLGEAQLEQGNLGDVKAALEGLNTMALNDEFSWRKQFLNSRWQRAEGRVDEALQSSTNLVVSANVTNRAQGFAFQADVLEQLKRYDEAVAAYQKNLAENVPSEQQRHALRKIADLNLRQNKTAEAVQILEKYLAQFPQLDTADLTLLTLGELNLKLAVAAPTLATNILHSASNHFETLLTRFKDSPLAARALLGKGWCLWLEGQTAESLAAFRPAAERLPVSKEQAEARFKWADAQLAEKDFAGAITNYNFVADTYAVMPEIKQQMVEGALYQTVRAALAAEDFSAASNAVRRILDWFPDGFAGPHSLLLTGEGLSQHHDAAAARQVFAELETRYPTNALVPELRLAIARTYERETNWDAAITNYTAWLGVFTNDARLPRAEFYRAWDFYMGKQETNALNAFTNFVARFPTNELAPRANWWIGDFYFNQGEYLGAENWYQLVFSTNAPASELAFEARMMAGRAAVARLRYKDAITYFTNLATDASCPLDLALQATFAYGDATMHLDSSETKKFANIEEARRIFSTIPQSYPTNALAPAAWGRIGDCYFQLGAADPSQYTNATAAYDKVMEMPQSSVAIHSEAKFKLATVIEKQAAQQGGDQNALLQLALNDYLDVLFGKDLHDGETVNAFWAKKAGLEAGRLAEDLHEWPQAVKVYRQLQEMLPSLGESLQKKILRAQERARGEKNSEKS
jgi:TolA-binding protein